jgi:recombination protein U
MTKKINSGKQFEDNFKKSVPDYCYCHRLKDSSQSFIDSGLSDFSRQNPCDFYLYDTKNRIFYAAELKSSKQKYISFENIDEEKPKQKMIRKNQILSLIEICKYNNIIAGFFFNFRDEEHGIERTYFQNIDMFMKMYRKIGKWSFNEIDLLLYSGIKINGDKLRVNYRWNLDEFLERQSKNFPL